MAVHVGVVAPISVLALTLIHVYFLGQPWGRGSGYGIFWGTIVAFGIVGATRAERQKREARAAAQHPDGDPRRRRIEL